MIEGGPPNSLLRRGFICNVAHDTTLRLLPPFVITRAEIDDFLRALDTVLGEIEAAELVPEAKQGA